jgi:PAS domain S-box-containing protein
MTKLRFLLLEDSLLDAELIQIALEGGGIQCDLVQVQTRAEFLAAVQAPTFDLILSDYRLPEFDGVAALELAHTYCPTIPFIFVSASLGEEMAIDLLKQGATDYVLKERLARLAPSIQRALREAQDHADRQAALEARQQAELALQQNQARLLLCVEAASLGLWDYDPIIDAGYLSDRCKIMVDLPPEAKLTHTQLLERLHPDDRPSVYEAIKRSLLHQDPYDLEFRVCWTDGTVHWIHAKGQTHHDAAGRPIWMGGVGIDITERKRVEAERKQAANDLRQSEERFRTLANAVPQLVWVNDEAGNLLYLNDPWRAYLGLPAETMMSWSQNDFTHPDDSQGMIETRDRGIAAKTAYELEARLRRADGQYRWHLIRAVPLKDEQDQVTFWYGTATDIEAVKQVAAGQRFLAQVSGVLTESLDYPLTFSRIAQLAVPFLADYCFFDILSANQQLQRVAWHHVNSEKQSWVSLTQTFVPPLSFAQHPVCQAVLHSASSLVPDVSETWLQSIAISAEHLAFLQNLELRSCLTVPLSTRNRKIGALMLCFTVESERRHTEADLQLAQELAYRAATALDNAQLYQQAQDANRVKDEFLAVLSHELRTPLNPILGWSKLLQSNFSDPVKVSKGLEAIERNAKMQTQLIEDLLDISQILRGKLNLSKSAVELSAIVEAAIETVQLSAEAKSIQLQTQLDPQVGQVFGDPGRLQQVVWNLLSNAIKFTPMDGQVAIALSQVELSQAESSQVEPSQVEPQTDPQPHYAQIQITDTGKGIAPEFLPHVFERFRQEDGSTTRQFGGLGLGLAIVHYIVQVHGGTVQAESAGEGQGSTFTVQLPLLPIASPLDQTGDRSPSSDDLSGLAILVVEDDLDTQELLIFLLEQRGAAVTAVDSATQALDILAQSPLSLLISDIGMPDLDGYMLLHRLRSHPNPNQQIPAIALTAYAGELNQQRALEVGFQRHLTKPIDPVALISAIGELIS